MSAAELANHHLLTAKQRTDGGRLYLVLTSQL
jgi:hypothetical protein